MTPAHPDTAALGWLRTMVPGLRAAAILRADGTVRAGDADAGLAAAAAAAPADALEAGVAVARGASVAVAVRVEAPVLPGLLRADLESVVATLERDRGA